MVSDLVVYRTLLRSGFERFDAVDRAVRLDATHSRVFQEKAWKLVVRYQAMALDGRLPMRAHGQGRPFLQALLHPRGGTSPELPMKRALVA